MTLGPGTLFPAPGPQKHGPRRETGAGGTNGRLRVGEYLPEVATADAVKA